MLQKRLERHFQTGKLDLAHLPEGFAPILPSAGMAFEGKRFRRMRGQNTLHIT